MNAEKISSPKNHIPVRDWIVAFVAASCAAFLIIGYAGISYLEVIKRAFLPAIISCIALVYLVHPEA